MHGTTYPPQSPPSRPASNESSPSTWAILFVSDQRPSPPGCAGLANMPSRVAPCRCTPQPHGVPDRLDVYHDWRGPRADAGGTDDGASVTRASDVLLHFDGDDRIDPDRDFLSSSRRRDAEPRRLGGRRPLRLPGCLPTPSGRRVHARAVGGRSLPPASRGSSVLVDPVRVAASTRSATVRRHRRPPAVARPIPPHPYARSRSQHRR